MERETKIKYTNAALEQLEKFKTDQARLLEEEIVSKKAYPGVDFIEITASDIQELSKNIIYRKQTKTPVNYLIVYLYFIIGIGLMIFGLFYEDLSRIWENHPNQALYILTGFAMTVMSGILLLYIRSKESKKRIEILRMYQDELEKLERIKFEEMNNYINKEKNKASPNNS